MSIPTFLDRAGQWFLDSGIQESNGGVARYRRTDTGRNLPVSNEITGYAASTFAYLHSATGRSAYRERALAAARFLTGCAWNRELATFPFEYDPPGNGLAYFFDSGIIVRGLLAVWRMSGDSEFLEIAAACGRSMARDFNQGACIAPILRLPEKQPLPCDRNWSRSSGCYQLKSAMAWFDLHEATGETAFLPHYRAALDTALRTHRSFLPGDPDPHRVMDRLHAYSYFLEALLPVTMEPAANGALREGIASVASYLREIGPSFERADVCAQLLRVRLFADSLRAVPLDREAAAFEAARLAAFQSDDAEPSLAGGFWFGRKGGAMLPFINPVSAGFGLQALAMWHAYLAGAPPLDRRALI